MAEPIPMILTCPSCGGRFRVDHLNPHQTTMTIAGQALTISQLSDLISAWIDAHPNENAAGGLNDWLIAHGRFE